MFGFIKHALHAVEKPFEGVAHFAKDHWKTLAVIAASTIAFVAVTALTGGLGAPFMAAMLAGGFASGVTGYTVANLLDHKPVTLKGALTAGVVSGVITVATAGVGRLAAPLLSRVAVPAVVSELSSSEAGALAVRAATNVATGSAFGAGQQVASNAFSGRPLGDGVGTAAVEGGINGALMVPAERFLPVPAATRTVAEPGTPATETGMVGMSGRLEGLVGNPEVTPGTAGTTSVEPVEPPIFTRTVGSNDRPIVRGPQGTLGDEPIEPSLPDEFKSVDYQKVQGDLWVDGAKASAVRQGQLGDCYLVASLASVADDQPHVIEHMIRLTPEGHYEVDLAHPRTLEPTTTTLSSALPLRNGTPIFAKIAQPDGKIELWPAMVEKAYAQVNGGYDVIGQGDSPAVSLGALMGKRAETMSTSWAGEDKVWNQLVSSDKNDWPTVAWTGKTVADSNVHGNHAYTLLGTKEGPNGERLVTLRNPWGYSPGSDGVFDMPLDKFVKDFPHVAWVEAQPAPPETVTTSSDTPIELSPWRRFGNLFRRHTHAS